MTVKMRVDKIRMVMQNLITESFFEVVMKEVKHQLYPGCSKISRLSFAVKLLHMKSLYRISNSVFSIILKYFRNMQYTPQII
jgi:hypothetical protein